MQQSKPIIPNNYNFCDENCEIENVNFTTTEVTCKCYAARSIKVQVSEKLASFNPAIKKVMDDINFDLFQCQRIIPKKE